LLENGNTKSLVRKMFPKVVKAVVKGALWFVFLYVLPSLLFSILVSRLPEGAPNTLSDFEPLLGVFGIIVVSFMVASEITSGTIFQHVFNIGKALILMVFIVYALRGGIFAMDFQNINILADLTIWLVMLLTVDLLALAKSVLQAINFLSEKAEEQLPTPSPKEY